MRYHISRMKRNRGFIVPAVYLAVLVLGSVVYIKEVKGGFKAVMTPTPKHVRTAAAPAPEPERAVATATSTEATSTEATPSASID